jgi:hypothetical protein
MRIEYETDLHYLTARVTGDWTSFKAKKVIKDILLELEKTSKSKLLFDLTNLSAPKSNIMRYHSGVKIAELLYKYKIAGFSQPEKINKHAEISATNRGANFQMFFSEIEALEWLLHD